MDAMHQQLERLAGKAVGLRGTAGRLLTKRRWAPRVELGLPPCPQKDPPTPTAPAEPCASGG
eukprot:6687820-Lingulodinium_polyedra.AAC.1